MRWRILDELGRRRLRQDSVGAGYVLTNLPARRQSMEYISVFITALTSGMFILACAAPSTSTAVSPTAAPSTIPMATIVTTAAPTTAVQPLRAPIIKPKRVISKALRRTTFSHSRTFPTRLRPWATCVGANPSLPRHGRCTQRPMRTAGSNDGSNLHPK